jgi:hypothetical protein
MCATSEGMEKGAKWCKRAIWKNTLPAVKHAWKSVDKLTSGAFVGMWHDRFAHFYSKYLSQELQVESFLTAGTLRYDASLTHPWGSTGEALQGP